MKVIGITGGVGSGKTALLTCLQEKYHCKVILADEAAHQVEAPGQKCYRQLVELLSDEILEEDGTINRRRFAQKIFENELLRKKVNEIVHPAVKQYIREEISFQREQGVLDFLFIEAALLIEDGYLNIVDEMWYIYAREDVRRERLRKNRNYSDEKIDAIMEAQLTEEEFRNACSVVIDNSGTLEESFLQIDRKVREYL